MMKRNKFLIQVLWLGLLSVPVAAQNSRGTDPQPHRGTAPQYAERLVPLQSNAELEAAYAASIRRAAKSAQTDSTEIRLELPFFDDFSAPGPYPSNARWCDNKVFINNSFPIHPPTYGVATFDGLNERGEIYSQARLNATFFADTLTSHALRLDTVTGAKPRALSVADSVYFSFYYQPGGGYGDVGSPYKRGTAPGKSDDLMLEFFDPVDTVWTIVWSASGMSLSEFCPFADSASYPVQNQHFFRMVMLPVVSEKYFHKDFRFRFINKTTIDVNSKSSGGQWHVDYVYVNADRRASQTALPDVGFVDVSPTVLSTYTRMPLKQFTSAHLAKELHLTLTNLSAQNVPVQYRCQITDSSSAQLWIYPEAETRNTEVYPFANRGYLTSPDLSTVPLGYDFGSLPVNSEGEVHYKVRHILASGIANEFSRINDTVETEQIFGFDFARDDGSAEAGWGLNYAGGAVAYPFDMNTPDTLRAVKIFFNRSFDDENFVPFNLLVWGRADNTDTMPGKVLYKKEGLNASAETGLNAFVTYVLDEPVALPEGRFYVGLEQTSSTFLNIGFDQNNTSPATILYSYYNTFDHVWGWNTSLYTGSLMIRPSFARCGKSPEAGNTDYCAKNEVPGMMRVIPNPVHNGVFSVRLPEGTDPAKVEISIYDCAGRKVKSGAYTEKISTAGLVPGIYMLKAREGKKETGFSKVVVP